MPLSLATKIAPVAYIWVGVTILFSKGAEISP